MRSFRMRMILIVALLSVGGAGCATLRPPVGIQSFSVLRSALTTSVQDLETLSLQNDARAQYALAIVYQYGLAGTPKNIIMANQLRRRALTPRGTTPITQYIASLNGKPGRTAIINLPRYDMTETEGRVNDICAEALSGNSQDSDSSTKCGGVQSYIELKPLWNERFWG